MYFFTISQFAKFMLLFLMFLCLQIKVENASISFHVSFYDVGSGDKCHKLFEFGGRYSC